MLTDVVRDQGGAYEHRSGETTATTLQSFWLGGELTLFRLGYGAMRLTGQPGNFGPYPDWEEGKALLRRAVDLGVDFIDTAEAYGPGWSERIVADASTRTQTT